MAAAIGSSIKSTLLEPACRAASSTARRSTSVTPEGMHTTILGRLRVPDFSAFLMKYFSMAAVTSKSAMTPSFKGRTDVYKRQFCHRPGSGRLWKYGKIVRKSISCRAFSVKVHI